LNIAEGKELSVGDRVVYVGPYGETLLKRQEENGGYLVVQAIDYRRLQHSSGIDESIKIFVEDVAGYISINDIERYEEPARSWSYELDY
jgi:hypothetical protein